VFAVQSLWSLWVFLRSEAPPGTVFPQRRGFGGSLRGAFSRRGAGAGDDDAPSPQQQQHLEEEEEEEDGQLSPASRMVNSVSSPRLQSLLGVAVGTAAAGGAGGSGKPPSAAASGSGPLLEMSGLGSARGVEGGAAGAAEGAPVGVPAGTGRAAAHLRTRSREVFNLSASDMV
jgi:hypothetical protein